MSQKRSKYSKWFCQGSKSLQEIPPSTYFCPMNISASPCGMATSRGHSATYTAARSGDRPRQWHPLDATLLTFSRNWKHAFDSLRSELFQEIVQRSWCYPPHLVRNLPHTLDATSQLSPGRANMLMMLSPGSCNTLLTLHAELSHFLQEIVTCSWCYALNFLQEAATRFWSLPGYLNKTQPWT